MKKLKIDENGKKSYLLDVFRKIWKNVEKRGNEEKRNLMTKNVKIDKKGKK